MSVNSLYSPNYFPHIEGHTAITYFNEMQYTLQNRYYSFIVFQRIRL